METLQAGGIIYHETLLRVNGESPDHSGASFERSHPTLPLHDPFLPAPGMKPMHPLHGKSQRESTCYSTCEAYGAGQQ